MPLDQGQASIGDLTLGRGTPYTIGKGFNPWRRQVRAESSGRRAWGDGGWSGAEFGEEAVVPIPLTVRGATSDIGGWQQVHHQLSAAFAPVGEVIEDVELRWNLDGTEYLMLGRPRMVEPDTNVIAGGVAPTRAAFVALDPVIYSGDLLEQTLGLPEFDGGLTVPLTVPFTVDAVAIDGEVDLTNEGTAEVGLLLTVNGPVVEPRLSLVHPDGTVQTIRFDLELQAGQWLEVDTKAHSVLLNGTQTRRGDMSGEWPMLPGQPVGTVTPEASTLLFRAGDDNDQAAVTVSHRHGWR